MDRTDDDLLAATRAGDLAAFAELWRRHEPSARAYARSLVQRSEVDDVVAEAFTKVLNAISRGNGPREHAVRYVMVAVRTSAFDLIASRRRDRDVIRLIEHEGVRHATLGRVSDDRLGAALATLPDRARQALWWVEVEGLSATEVGRGLGINAGAATAFTYRARKALRAAYADHDPDRDGPDEVDGQLAG